MIKTVNRKFLATIILYSTYFLGGIGLLTYGYIKYGGGNLLITITFGFLLVTLLVTSWASNRLNYLMNLSYIIKISDSSGEPLKISRVNDTNKLFKYLDEKEYIEFNNDISHYLFYRVTKDTIKKIFSMYMLEVVVYINKDESEFYLEIVNDEINKIKEKLSKEKKTVNRMFITQYKEVDTLDEKTKKSLSEIVFIRTRNHIISTINVGVLDNELAVMLYSDTYSPSLYYKYHIEQIKDMI